MSPISSEAGMYGQTLPHSTVSLIRNLLGSPEYSTTIDSCPSITSSQYQQCITASMIPLPKTLDMLSSEQLLGPDSLQQATLELPHSIQTSQYSLGAKHGGVMFNHNKELQLEIHSHCSTPLLCGNDKDMSPSLLSIDRTMSPVQSSELLKEITINSPCRSLQREEEIILTGGDLPSSYGPPLVTPTVSRSPSGFPSRSNTPLNSPEGETFSEHCQPQKATYWALTIWEASMHQETVLQLLAKMGPLVLSILGSVPHQCQEKPQLHRHCLLKISRQIRRTQFPRRMLGTSHNPMWKGYPERRLSQIHKLRKGQWRSPLTKRNSIPPSDWSNEPSKQED